MTYQDVTTYFKQLCGLRLHNGGASSKYGYTSVVRWHGKNNKYCYISIVSLDTAAVLVNKHRYTIEAVGGSRSDRYLFLFKYGWFGRIKDVVGCHVVDDYTRPDQGELNDKS